MSSASPTPSSLTIGATFQFYADNIVISKMQRWLKAKRTLKANPNNEQALKQLEFARHYLKIEISFLFEHMFYYTEGT